MFEKRKDSLRTQNPLSHSSQHTQSVKRYRTIVIVFHFT